MAAVCKTELREAASKEFAKLIKLIEPLDSKIALSKGEDDTSIKDVVGHRAHWIDLFLGWYTDGLAGKPVFFPAQGYKWNDLKRYNGELREKQRKLSWSDSVSLLTTNHEKLMAFIESKDDETLYGGPMQGANNHWTPGRWAEAAGPSHYRSAAKFIRSELRRLDAS